MSDLKITPAGDCDLVMTRSFDATRDLVFLALSKPEFVRRWMLGPPGWKMTTCDIDLRVGGAYRYLWRHDAGHEMGVKGVYKEIKANERIVHTEIFDESWYAGEAVVTAVLVETKGRTLMTSTVRYASREARDTVLKSNMESGVAASYNRLAEVLNAMKESP